MRLSSPSPPSGGCCINKVGTLLSKIMYIIKRNKEMLTMARNQRSYDPEYKAQAVKPAREMGSCKKAADELCISPNTLHGRIKGDISLSVNLTVLLKQTVVQVNRIKTRSKKILMIYGK